MRCPRPEVELSGSLPTPDPAAAAHGARVREALCTEAARHGGILPFRRFMELALYAPGLGYYTAGSRKLGEQGDFVTAPEISPLFSRCIARQCAQVLQGVGGDLLEFGAGSGAMAADLLLELERLETLPESYLILDLSPDLQARQRETLEARVPHLLSRVQWLSSLPASFRGVMIANEVLDAMPVHRFRREAGSIAELGVTCTPDGLRWSTLPPDERVRARVEALVERAGMGEPYESEINLAAEDWIRSLADILEAGALLLIDYGFPEKEFYHPQRNTGTLMCHYRHRTHPDPLILVGLQDITTHVDFTAVAEAAYGAGLHVAGYTNQANFLLATGLLEMISSPADPRSQVETSAQVKKLTMPMEMGELFKVMALTRGFDGKLAGFALRDDRVRL